MTARAGELLPVSALTTDGLLIRDDGAFVRYIELRPGNPLVLDDEGCDRMTRGYTELLLRVPPGMPIQLYAQATPVALEGLVQDARAATHAALAGAPRDQAEALKELAGITERSLTAHADQLGATTVRFVLVCPYVPDQEPRATRLGTSGPKRRRRSTATRTRTEHDRLAAASLQHADRLRGTLAGLDIDARLLDGAAVADLLGSRANATKTPPPSTHGTALFADLAQHHAEELATHHTRLLRAAICQTPIDLRPARHIVIADQAERTICLTRRPERTFYGWLLHAMQSPLAWTLTTHITPRDRGTERDRHNRAARRLWGLNEGAADRRARPDRAQHDQQAELEEIVDELSSGAETLCDVSVYLSLRAPVDAPAQLDEAATAALRDIAAPTDAAAYAGEGAQPDLWQSTLPLGLDVAKRTFSMLSRNAADTVPFLSTSCGSPGGLPFAFAAPGRTVERLDPFDRRHDNATTLLFAKSGGGKTMTTIALAAAALPRGCQVNVLDRSAGHWRLLCDLIPGAAHLELGQEDGPAINPWDTDDATHVPRAKVAFLVHLHALLVGDHDTAGDAYGLGPLERNLLALAIRRTYETAAETMTAPRESLLRATLFDLAHKEAADADGSQDNAATFRNLAHRLGELCGEGTYGFLFDRETTLDARDAPMIVFNTRQVPDDVSAPLLFTVLELVARRVERRHQERLEHIAAGYDLASPLDGSSAVVVEELWKLLERRATGGWVVELAKRARHIGLWFIAITQQRSDLATTQGRALLDNSTIQLLLRNGADDLAHLTEALNLAPEEAAQVARLTTEKGSHAQAYLLNGERGRGTVTLRHGPELYWLATSDPVRDVPRREQALRAAGFHDAEDEVSRSRAAFAALRALAADER